MLGSEDDGFELVEDRSAARSAMCALDDRARKMLRLRFMAGKTQSEIAAELGVSQMHVSRLLRRALAKLRENGGCGRLRVAIALKRRAVFSLIWGNLAPSAFWPAGVRAVRSARAVSLRGVTRAEQHAQLGEHRPGSSKTSP